MNTDEIMVTRIGSAQTVKSLKSVFSVGSKSIFSIDDKLAEKIWTSFKLLLVVAPPIAVVFVLCTMSLISGKASMDLKSSLKANLISSQSIGKVASLLAQERGMTCIYLSVSSQDHSADVYNALKVIRRNVDISINEVTNWYFEADDGTEFNNKQNFSATLYDFRNRVGINVTKCEEALWWYTRRTNTIIEQTNREFRRSAEGKFWASVSSYYNILLTKDLLGLERAIGGSFFSKGYFSLDDYVVFSKLDGAAEYFLNLSLYMTPSAEISYWQDVSNNADLISTITLMKNHIFQNQTRLNESNIISIEWFDNMTSYIDVVDRVKSLLENVLRDSVEMELATYNTNFTRSIAIIAVVLIVCPATTVMYAVQSKRMMKKIKHFTNQLISKSKDLDAEKKKTELILYQMLPKSVVADLKMNKAVPPEMFESVTIYFSDIQGFTMLSAILTPFEVVDLLNHLYTTFDGVLDQYDVYKVETIGDAYMVVSGMPKRNGVQHSAAICTMSLHLLMSLNTTVVPRNPGDRLLLRIGVHTGACAAGVVGVKMPRYCLFGDTVNTASRMESNGKALRVHLSGATAQHLISNFGEGFDIESRGMITVKGKGSMETFWLLGKQGFPYSISLEESTTIADETKYCQ